MNEPEVLQKVLETLERIEKLLDKKVNPPHPLSAHLAAAAKANPPKEKSETDAPEE